MQKISELTNHRDRRGPKELQLFDAQFRTVSSRSRYPKRSRRLKHLGLFAHLRKDEIAYSPRGNFSR
jgi:hypothetical protein